MAGVLVMVAQDAGGRVIEAGDHLFDFRGDEWIFEYPSRATVPGKSGKVCVFRANRPDDQREFYANVLGLVVNAMLTCGCPAGFRADACTEPHDRP